MTLAIVISAGLVLMTVLPWSPQARSAALALSGPEALKPALVSQAYEATQIHMGVPVRLVLYEQDRTVAETAARAAFARIEALDRVMSDYRPDSELRRLEHHAGPVVVSPDLFKVVHRAVEISRVTHEAFDPTVGPLVALWRDARRTGRLPSADDVARARSRVGWRKLELDSHRSTLRLAVPGMRLDLGGIAKGYILQEALHTLRTLGVTRALVEAGGDIVAGSPPPGRNGWRIDAAGADAVFRSRAENLADAALATSGGTVQFVEIDGVRYSHVIDPRTGLGATNGVVARVIARDGATADALATALSVMGDGALPTVAASFPDVLVSLGHH